MSEVEMVLKIILYGVVTLNIFVVCETAEKIVKIIVERNNE